MTHEAMPQTEIVAEADIDVKAQRAAFHRGFVALKKHLAETVAAQMVSKRALRMPRKNAEERERLQTVLAQTELGKKYPGQTIDVTHVQSRAAERAMVITAILHVHAEVRGKTAGQNPGKFSPQWFAYAKKTAREIFETAAKAEA